MERSPLIHQYLTQQPPSSPSDTNGGDIKPWNNKTNASISTSPSANVDASNSQPPISFFDKEMMECLCYLFCLVCATATAIVLMAQLQYGGGVDAIFHQYHPMLQQDMDRQTRRVVIWAFLVAILAKITLTIIQMCDEDFSWLYQWINQRFWKIKKTLAVARGLKMKGNGSNNMVPAGLDNENITITGDKLVDATSGVGQHSVMLILLMFALDTVFTLTYMYLSAQCTDGYVEGGDVHISRPRTLHYLNPQPQDIECAQLVPIEQPSKSCSRCSCDSELYQPLIGVKNSAQQKDSSNVKQNSRQKHPLRGGGGKSDRIIYV